MKKSLLALLAALLAANAVLLLALLKSPARSAPSNLVSAAKENSSGHKSRNPQQSEALAEEQIRSLALTADFINTTDLPTLVSRLRAAGFSTDLQRISFEPSSQHKWCAALRNDVKARLKEAGCLFGKIHRQWD